MKKIGMLVLVLVFALGALGVGYAHWSQTLFINTKVQTGELCWGFEQGSLEAIKDSDVEPPPYVGGATADQDWSCNVSFYGIPWSTGKNVAWVTVNLTDEKECMHEGAKLYATANITVHNAYPSYYNDFHCWVYNGGTIPLIVDAIQINSDNLSDGEHYIGDWFEIEWGDAIGAQIDPCSGRELSFKFHVIEAGDYVGKPGAEQGQTYYFTITLVGVQWDY